MSMTSRKFTTEFKANVAIEAIKEQQTIVTLSKKYDLHPTQINTWKKGFLSNSSAVFKLHVEKHSGVSRLVHFAAQNCLFHSANLVGCSGGRKDKKGRNNKATRVVAL
jgi:hypothetical protein